MIEAELENQALLSEKYLLKETGPDLNLVKEEGLGIINLIVDNLKIWSNIKKAQFQQGNHELIKQFKKALELAQKNL